VTVRVSELLGRVEDSGFSGRRVVEVPVAWDEASRRRLRRTAADGTDVTIDLAGGAYLADGVVLADDGERVLAVARLAEPALVVHFDLSLPPARLVQQALAVGQAFGNQHVPIDVAPGEARIPLTTSEPIARATVEALELEGARLAIAEVALGATRPLSAGHAHAHHDRD
jgi:urease accessory protein